MTNQIQKANTQAIANPKNMKDHVLNKIVDMQSSGGITLPAGYDPTNALHNAWLQFEDNPKLMNTSDHSKANSLLKMVALGLDSGKQQGYFIPYGNNVQFQTSYHGNMLILKRDAGAVSVNAQVVYKGDNFEFDIDPMSGKTRILKHSPTLESMNGKDPIAAYAVIHFEDTTQNHVELMTFEQIKQAWLQSPMIKDEKALENSKTHNKFQEEMIRKTVINRAAKRFVNTTSVNTNSKLVQDIEQTERKQVFDAEVDENQAVEQLDFDQETGEIFNNEQVIEPVQEELKQITPSEVNTDDTASLFGNDESAPF